nr:MAG TPA: hypothetical protein [Caudoviricetes sp.]
MIEFEAVAFKLFSRFSVSSFLDILLVLRYYMSI